MADILSDLNFWIAVGTGVAAGAAWRSAFLSQQANQAAANAAQATLYLSFQQQYASDQMLQDLRKLREWREEQGADFASKWEEQWIDNDETREVDRARRRVSHFFGAIAELFGLGLLSKRTARRLANFSGDLLFLVVEPLEQRLGSDYDRSQFDILADLTRYLGPRPSDVPTASQGRGAGGAGQ